MCKDSGPRAWLKPCEAKPIVSIPSRRCFWKGQKLGIKVPAAGLAVCAQRGRSFKHSARCQNWLCCEYMFRFWDTGFPIRVLGVCRMAEVSRVRCNSFILAGNGRVKAVALRSMRLLLESGDGSPAREYRIEDGNVEVRTLDPDGGSVRTTGSAWWRLTPQQLSIHVERNTVVAWWLERRLGWRRLLQACVDSEPRMGKVA